jgi:predicted nucleic acid-binding protein
VTRYVVDLSAMLHLVEEEIEVADDHELLAPTLIRSQMLDALYQAVRRGALSEQVGRQRLERFGKLRIRLLGDAVLRRKAWAVAEQLHRESTSVAEYVALTQLQADALVTMDEGLARSVQGIVETASIDELRRG